MREGNKRARVVVPAATVRALDAHRGGRTARPIFLSKDDRLAAALLGRKSSLDASKDR